jgi:hypothetical protein
MRSRDREELLIYRRISDIDAILKRLRPLPPLTPIRKPEPPPPPEPVVQHQPGVPANPPSGGSSVKPQPRPEPSGTAKECDAMRRLLETVMAEQRPCEKGLDR